MIDLIKNFNEKRRIRKIQRINEKLIQSVQENNKTKVKSLLEKGADVNFSYPAADPALLIACENPDADMVKMLLDHGADIYRTGYKKRKYLDKDIEIYYNRIDDYVPLEIAAQNGHTNIVDLLLEKEKSMGSRDASLTDRALIKAAKNGHIDTVSLLIKTKKAANLQTDLTETAISDPKSNKELEGDKGVESALISAVNGNQEDVVKYLLKNGGDVNSQDRLGGDLLIEAAMNNNLSMVKMLFKNGADIKLHEQRANAYSVRMNSRAEKVQFNTALAVATEKNNIEMVDLLLKKGADTKQILTYVKRDDVYNFTPLSVAAKKGHNEIAKKLIDHGADVNFYDYREKNSCLTHAVKNGHTKITKLLLDNGAEESLLPAVDNNQINIVKQLLEKGVDINKVVYGRYGDTALSRAVNSKNIEMVNFLLENGADIESGEHYSNDRPGFTPLMLASNCGRIDIAETLLKNGANIDAYDDGGEYTFNNSLTVATNRDDAKMVKFLLENGAKTEIDDTVIKNNLTNPRKELLLSPLMIATDRHREDIVGMLIKHGADVNYRCENKAGEKESCLTWAVQCDLGGEGIVSTLLHNGANINRGSDYDALAAETIYDQVTYTLEDFISAQKNKEIKAGLKNPKRPRKKKGLSM